MPKNEGTDSIFKSGIMEKLTRTHISIPVTIHSVIVGVFLYLSIERVYWMYTLPLFFTGWLFWTFSEYWIHRYVYHVKTDKKWLLKIQHVGHGIHHQYPKDPTRLAMPPVPAVLLLSVMFGLFWLILGNLAFAFFPGFVFGYLLYISLHYAQHRLKTPKIEPFRTLWKSHAMHHYKHPEDKVFGVSTLLWDRIFGTMPDKN